MFRSAFKKRRCLIVADGYYEWKKLGKEKQPFLYRMKADAPFAFAGLWEHWEHEGEVIDSCTIITTDANDLAHEFTTGCPCFWDLTHGSRGSIRRRNLPLCKAYSPLYPPEKMEAYSVSPAVNSVKNNGPELIAPAI